MPLPKMRKVSFPLHLKSNPNPNFLIVCKALLNVARTYFPISFSFLGVHHILATKVFPLCFKFIKPIPNLRAFAFAAHSVGGLKTMSQQTLFIKGWVVNILGSVAATQVSCSHYVGKKPAGALM